LNPHSHSQKNSESWYILECGKFPEPLNFLIFYDSLELLAYSAANDVFFSFKRKEHKKR
jgi:hypothetical protein